MSCIKTRDIDTIAPFIQILREILNVETKCIRWANEGKAFDIVDAKQFTKEIIPKYFRHHKFTSFQRQLNYFGFRKQSRRHSSVCTYAHAYFSLRHPFDASRIKRKATPIPKVKPRCGITVGYSKPPQKSRVILAYTEASLAYSEALIKSMNSGAEFKGTPSAKPEPESYWQNQNEHISKFNGLNSKPLEAREVQLVTSVPAMNTAMPSILPDQVKTLEPTITEITSLDTTLDDLTTDICGNNSLSLPNELGLEDTWQLTTTASSQGFLVQEPCELELTSEDISVFPFQNLWNTTPHFECTVQDDDMTDLLISDLNFLA